MGPRPASQPAVWPRTSWVELVALSMICKVPSTTSQIQEAALPFTLFSGLGNDHPLLFLLVGPRVEPV